jgi:hypothetical protein
MMIRFKNGATSLYDVGYILADINQLVVFSALLEQKRDLDIDRWYGEGPRVFHRRAAPLIEHVDVAKVVHAHDGSINLAVLVKPLMAPLVVKLVWSQVEKRIRPQHFDVEVSVCDQRVKRGLDEYEKGTFGDGAPAIEYLFKELAKGGYNVTLRGKDAYVIESVVGRYSARVVRTIRRR